MEVLSVAPKIRKKKSQPKTTGMIRIGLAGCGYWGPNLIRNFHDLPTTQITAICDTREERLRPLLKKFPLAKFSTRYPDLISNPHVDAVVIATPISTHYEMARRALAAGKHVLVEKPLAETVRQAEALTELAARCDRILMVGHTFEYHPAVLKVSELLQAGELGKLHYIDSVRVNLGLYQSDGFNVIWDLAPHDVSIILSWVGETPRRVSAWGRAFVHTKAEDVAFIRLEFPGGVLAHSHVSWLAPTKIRRMTVAGDKKMVIYDDLDGAEKIKIADRGAELDLSNRQMRFGYRMGDIVIPRLDTTEALAQECSHFVDCILEHRNPRTDGNSGTQVVRVLEAADKSIKKGGAVVSL